MRKNIFWLKTLLLVILILLCMGGNAFASIASAVVKDNNDYYFVFNYDEMLESYTRKVLGFKSVLFDDFSSKKVVALATENSLYIDYDDILQEYTRAVIQQKKFDIIKYIESDSAKPFNFTGQVKAVAVVNDKLVYSDWQPPQQKSAFEIINSSNDSVEVANTLQESAIDLSLNLDDYNKLNSYGKIQVATDLINNRPDKGYENTDAIKVVFIDAVSQNLTAQQAALAAVNQATTPEAMRAAVTEHATRLELDISRFDRLKPESQQELLAIMVEKLPYDTADQVKTAYITALQTVSSTTIITYVDYEHSLTYAVDKQMNKSPQTDLYGGGWKTADRNLVEWFINANNFVGEMLPALKVKNVHLNMRHEPTTEKNNVILTLSPGAGPYFIISEAQDSKGDKWYRILTNSRVGWVHGNYVELTEKKGEGIFQFLLLSGTTYIDPVEVNEKILKDKGILSGKAEAFIEGAQKYNINEIFLISLALHETGNGTSKLATGVEYKGKTVYNMYGIGAVDSDPINKGAEYAYNQGWFTPEAAIIGGAKFAGENYIHHPTYKQDTLYKMRWNPANPGVHQYATDIGWAAKQVANIKKLYDQLTSYVLHFEIPRYK